MKGNGTVYQRKSDKKWVTSIDNGKDQYGKRDRIVVYSFSEKEAYQKLNAIQFELQTGDYQKISKDTLVGFLKEFHCICSGCDMWNDSYIYPLKSKWEQTTASLYKMYIDVHFEPYFKSQKLADIKPIQLDKFYNYKMIEKREYRARSGSKYFTKYAKPLSINSTRKLNTFLKAAFHYAVLNKIIKDNPTDGVLLREKEEYKPKIYDDKKFMNLLNTVEGTSDEIPIILGAGCGMRRGEVFGLRWKNIDFKTGIISIEKTSVRFDKNIEKKPKTKTSARSFVAPKYVLESLESYKREVKGRSDDKIVSGWKANSYSGRFKTLLEVHNLPPIRFHDLRHYNAILMLKNGVSDKVASERLGHNVATLRKTYQHVLSEMDESAADKINSTISKTKSDKSNRDNFKVV